jgi:hypothetical protein
MNKHIFIPIILFSLFSCSRNKENLEYLICKDSLQYWDLVSCKKQDVSVFLTYSFKKDGTYTMYDIDKVGNRRIMTYGNGDVEIEKWSISNDSIFTINVGKSKITRCNEDTIYLGMNEKRNLLIRVKGKINLINIGDPGDTLKKFKQLAPI